MTHSLALLFLHVSQLPLQPLKDNLESATYEVFEKDPVKYVQYENAVCGAIRQRKSRKVSAEHSSDDIQSAPKVC